MLIVLRMTDSLSAFMPAGEAGEGAGERIPARADSQERERQQGGKRTPPFHADSPEADSPDQASESR